MRSPITTHVLDTSLGRPAEGVHITLEQLSESSATSLASGTTNADGRIEKLLEPGTLKPGVYRITFFVKQYLESQHQTGFYPEIPVIFEISATDEHYHVPLLLNPYGYSTYRGS